LSTSKFHGILYAVLTALFLLGSGTLAYVCMQGSSSHARPQELAGAGIVEIPISPYLPNWFFPRKAVSISRESNSGVLKSAYEVFDPSVQSFLAEVPIVFDTSATTARAYQSRGYIGVSPDWDNIVLRSEYRAVYEQRGMKPDDPVFMQRFKTSLLIHEFLHLLQVRQGIASRSCYEAVAKWYADPRYGVPSPDGIVTADMTNNRRPDTLAINRTKYILWHSLYNYQKLSAVPHDDGWKTMHYGDRYQWADKGVEEFAYIGEEILAAGSSSENYIETGKWSDQDWNMKRMKLFEVSPEIIALFRGVFNPVLMQEVTN
jgi:hypothetical protein